MYALVQRHGADYDHPGTGSAVWPAGFHWASPFVRVSHLVTKQCACGGGRRRAGVRSAFAALTVSPASLALDADIVFDTPVKGEGARARVAPLTAR